MASREATVGLLVPLAAKTGKENDVAEFLLAGYDLVLAEPETIQWFGVKFSAHTPNTFAIFDTFPTESGRAAHLSGKVAEALLANAPELLSPAPQIGQVNVLASKVKSSHEGGKTAGLSVGLRVLIAAKPEKIQAVRDFLVSAKPIVDGEEDTPVWYALEFPGTNGFAIIDFFPHEQGRDAHLGGKVAEALFANADELLASPPDVAKFDVLAAKVLA